MCLKYETQHLTGWSAADFDYWFCCTDQDRNIKGRKLTLFKKVFISCAGGSTVNTYEWCHVNIIDYI